MIKCSLEYIIKKLQNILSIKEDGYKNKSINSIVIQYGFLSGKAPTDTRLPEKSNITQNYKHYKLPIALDPLKFGTVIHEEARKNGHFYIIQSSIGNVYKIIQYVDPQTNLINNNVEVVRNGHTVLLLA